MPALELGTDWATLSAGTSMRIGRNITGYAMVLGELGQDKETSYGGQAGINVALDWQ
jgi:outer membrane autotransporter protein